MPQIIVTADHPTDGGDRPMMFTERVSVQDFESDHFRAQLVIGAVALLAAAWAGLGALDVAVLAVTTAIVLGAELLNSAIETLTDLVHPDLDPAAAVVKDVSAAAAMTAAGLALAVGVLVFLPRLSALSSLASRGIPLILSLVCLVLLSGGVLRRR